MNTYSRIGAQTAMGPSCMLSDMARPAGAGSLKPWQVTLSLQVFVLTLKAAFCSMGVPKMSMGHVGS